MGALFNKLGGSDITFFTGEANQDIDAVPATLLEIAGIFATRVFPARKRNENFSYNYILVLHSLSAAQRSTQERKPVNIRHMDIGILCVKCRQKANLIFVDRGAPLGPP